MSRTMLKLVAILPAFLLAVNARSICSRLESVAPGIVEMPGTAGYEDGQAAYYSVVQTDLTPACRVAPKSAADVSTVMKTAVKAKIPFAVHSGGHFMTLGGSNIGEEGFTIDLAGLNTIELAKDEKTVKIGSGNRWEDVFAPLAEKGLHAAGGRDPGIGAGGFLLGGGVSFLSYEHGLGADNVVEYEVVLASGEIVLANAKEHSDLFWALKLGSTNYGIVTSFTVNVYPVGTFWSGYQVYNWTDADELLGNFPAYVDAANYNDTAAFTQFSLTVINGEKAVQSLMAFRTEEEKPPLWQVLAGDAVPAQDVMGLTDILGTLENVRDTTKFRTIPMTLTLNNVDESMSLHKDQFEWSVERFAEFADLEGWSFFTAVQPFPTAYLQADSPILSRGKENAMILLMKVTWTDAENDDAIQAAMEEWLAYCKEQAEARGVLHPLVYLNYAGQTQTDVYTSSVTPEDLKKMQKIRAKYDPKLSLAKLWPGGVKLPQPKW